MSDSNDRIERQIVIDAPADVVWTLVSEPGWWINTGTIVKHRIESKGDFDVVHDDHHGAFGIRTERLDAPRYAAFRWLNQPEAGSESTLTEFWIEDIEDGASVLLRVAESGFASLSGSEQDRRKHLDDNTEGWETELAAAKTHLTKE